jgi:tryptophan synthase alpha chain
VVEGARAITEAIETAEGSAICAYVTAGFPTLEGFSHSLLSVAKAADVVEVGVPFTDPMADGLTIQQASHVALENGVNLDWILEILRAGSAASEAPILLMGYYNPFLAYGLDRLGDALAEAQVSGLIVPDLPYDESAELRVSLDPHEIALVQLVTPSTPDERLARLAAASGGFVYAVTTTGVTGGETAFDQDSLDYLARVREVSPVPVLAGFGIRNANQVKELAPYVAGVVVGSALIDAIDRGEDPGDMIAGLRFEGVTA